VAERGATASPWAIVVALGITQIISWGSLYYAFSLMIEPLAVATGGGRSAVVGAFCVSLLVAGLASAPVGRLIDRRGGRWVMAAGSVGGGLLLAALAHVGSLWQLYAVWALLGAVMAMTLYDPAFAVLGQVFRERQRQAITALTLFGGFASTVFWPLTQWLVQQHGWQHALLVLGLLNLLLCAPLHAGLLPAPQAREPQGPLPGRAPATSLAAVLRDPTFYGLCAAFTGNALVFSAMSVHLIPLLQGKGLSVAQAAWVGALVGPMQVLGRLLEYVFLGRWHPSRVGALAMWLLPLSLGLLALLPADMAGLAVFALLYGSGNGVMTIVRGAIPAELYGRESYGAVNGAMATPVLLSKAAGPIAASVVLAVSAQPSTMILCLAMVGIVSATLFTWTVRRHHTQPLPNPSPHPHP